MSEAVEEKSAFRLKMEKNRNTQEKLIKETDWYWEGERKARPVSWHVKDLIPAKAVGLIVGESRAGKTFVALDLAVATAEGREFFGKPAIQGGVLYIAAEGEATIAPRLTGARQGRSPTKYTIATIYLRGLLTDEEVLASVIADAQIINQKMIDNGQSAISLVVVDTLLAAMGVSNWNDASEASAAIGILKEINRALGATVIGVHHHGKDTSKGAAGSYALVGSPDFILSAFRKSKDDLVTDRWISVTKNRYGREGQILHFKLDTLLPDYWDGENGDEPAFVTPLLDQKHAVKKVSKTARLSPGDECLRNSVDAVLTTKAIGENHPEFGQIWKVKASDVRAKFSESYDTKGSTNPSEAVRKAWRRALANAKSIGVVEDGEWLCVKPD